jgi:hypothetical protein
VLCEEAVRVQRALGIQLAQKRHQHPLLEGEVPLQLRAQLGGGAGQSARRFLIAGRGVARQLARAPQQAAQRLVLSADLGSHGHGGRRSQCGSSRSGHRRLLCRQYTQLSRKGRTCPPLPPRWRVSAGNARSLRARRERARKLRFRRDRAR